MSLINKLIELDEPILPMTVTGNPLVIGWYEDVQVEDKGVGGRQCQCTLAIIEGMTRNFSLLQRQFVFKHSSDLCS